MQQTNREHEDRRTTHNAELPVLMSVDDVSHVLGVPKATLYRWHSMTTRERQVGPRAFRVGRHLRYLQEDLTAYIHAQRGSVS